MTVKNTAIVALAAIASAFERNVLNDVSATETPADAEIYQGRGGKRLLTVADAIVARDALSGRGDIVEALRPLAAIADAFDDNALDDEARKFWGAEVEFENKTPHNEIDLVNTSGGGSLLTLAHAMEARTFIAQNAA